MIRIDVDRQILAFMRQDAIDQGQHFDDSKVKPRPGGRYSVEIDQEVQDRLEAHRNPGEDFNAVLHRMIEQIG